MFSGFSLGVRGKGSLKRSIVSSNYYVLAPGYKVQPTDDTPALPETSISMVGPKASYQGSQIILNGGDTGLTNVVVNDPTDLSDGGGNNILASNLALFKQYW